MKRIGVSFSSPETAMGMFSNGIRQNALFFTELLMNIGYDVELIIQEKYSDVIQTLYGFDNGRFKYSFIENLVNANFDLVVQFGIEIPENTLIELKRRGVKLIAYHCGNDYIYDTENALHGKEDRRPQFSKFSEKIFDEIWSIPQMANSNLHYWATLYRTTCREVPFVWSPMAIEEYERDCMKTSVGDLKYCKREDTRIAVFEPNVNVFKWAFPAILVCENAYRKGTKIDHVYVTNINGNSKFNLRFFNTLVKRLDLNIDKKISIEDRYNTLIFMKKHASIAVSHQWENPLNYLYLDLAWMGWPIVHNAHLCKDIGYYYEGFNYEMGGDILTEAVKYHELNAQEYLKKNRKAIERYLPSNDVVQQKYRNLIERVLNLNLEENV
jgi:hypothetical protein